MLTFITRPTDPQAVKVAACAELSKSAMKIVEWSKAKKLDDSDFPPFSGRQLALLLEDGSVLGDVNAMARYLMYDIGSSSASSSSSPGSLCPSHTAEWWIEWEEVVLRPMVYGGSRSDVLSALQELVASVSGNGSYLAGDALGLEDVVVGCTLRAGVLMGVVDFSGEWDQGSVLKGYYDRFISSPCVDAGIEAVGLFKGKDDVEAAVVARADVSSVAAKKIPRADARNILITSALPYVNNVPHLGNIIGCVLSADVYARFCRGQGYNCVYVCGTDEYGTATETKAIEEGMTCQELCDKYHAIHREIYDWFDIEFDYFGRTPTRYQTEIAQSMFHQLRENGFLEEKVIEQLYSEPLKKFLADRYVTGICPKCGYEDARGDQCDACGALLNPTELKAPKCALSGSTPVLKSTSHVFLNLPKLQERLTRYIEKSSSAGGWSSNCMAVTKAWLEQGLKSRCISRDLNWGTPVPMDGFRDKVFYVWFDAPIGYVSITAGYCGDDWKAWWKPSEYFSPTSKIPEVEMTQFMGKDNVPFHTLIFPACQIGTGEPWTMMTSISVTEYLNYEDGKFSKSRGVGVFGNDAKETGIPVEVWRYYLLSMRPENQDSAFQWDDFAAKNNAELNDNLGNFINRTLKFVFARFGATVPGIEKAAGNAAVAKHLEAHGNRVAKLVEEYTDLMEAKKMRQALHAAMQVSKAGNLFFQETEIWKVVKEDEATGAAYISACVGTVAVIATLLEPFMPSFTVKVLKQLNVPCALAMGGSEGDGLVAMCQSIGTVVPGGHKLKDDPTPIFRKITEEEVASFRERFAGTQADRSDGTQDAGKKADKKAEAKLAETKAEKKKASTKGDVTAKMAKMTINDNIDISRVDIRVGKIVECAKHPDADSLYVEKIDVGEAEPRTVVSGLVRYIPLDGMMNKKVAVVCNLKPANMRGIKSHAMVLAATSVDGETVELLDPPADAEIGQKVECAEFKGEPDEVLNPKKKVWDQVVVDLLTDEARKACFRGVPLTVNGKPCTVASISKGTIK